ncbi:MAG: Dabb family protein [Ruthenibacterium sp.]
MLRHGVMWKFREGTEPEMRRFLTVAENTGKKENFDAVLLATFQGQKELEAYRSDPRHLAVSALCKAIRTERRVVDYEF